MPAGPAGSRAAPRTWPRCAGVRYSTGEAPSTRARASSGSRAATRADQVAAPVPSRCGGHSRPAAFGRSCAVAAVWSGRMIALSSRWFRQNATSNAGSPNQPHSASSSTGPCGPSRMFLGLTSPCTTARWVPAVVGGQLVDPVGQVGVGAGGDPEVGLDAQGVEVVVGGERARERWDPRRWPRAAGRRGRRRRARRPGQPARRAGWSFHTG